MAKVIITIESNWKYLTREQQDYLCRKYAQTLIKYSIEKKNKKKQPDKPS